MEVPKVPPADVPTARAGTAAAAGQGSRSAVDIEPLVDRADIRPLDIPGALQILLAEVRAALDLPPETVIAAAAAAQSPARGVRELVEMLLQVLPADASDAAAWTAALVRVEASMRSSIERAIDIVSQWHDVPPAVVDAVKEARTMFLSALADDAPNPLWLRPEWLGLAPRVHRFRRRRRNARRRLIDPDYAPGSLDEAEEFRQ
jgi:hypothetical protein